MCGRGFGFGSCRPANPGLRIETWGTQWCSDLNDVLRTVANPEVPERVRVNVRTRVWVRELSARKPRSQNRDLGHPVVFAPEVFLAQMSAKRDARSTGTAVLLHVAAIALLFWAVKSHVRSEE